LQIVPVTDTLLEASICAGDSFYFAGNYLSQSGIYYDSLISGEGCDSIVRLSLTVLPIKDTLLEASICAGDSYWFKGFMLNQSGSYFDTSTSVLGCDSVIQLDLSVLSFVYFTLVDTICFGQEYFFNGVGYSTSQYGLTDTFATNGCDSIVILSLHVLAAPELSVADTTVCGAFWYQDTQILSDTTLVDTMRNERGCDSLMLHLNVRVLPESHQFIRAELLGCRSVLFEQRLFTVDTLLRDTLFNHYGCDSAYREISIHIEQFDLNVVANPPQPYYGEVVELRAISDMDFSISAWMPSDLFPRQTFSEQQLRLTREVLVTVAGESALGCRDTASTLLRPLQFSTDIFIPNAFSPNADGLNDVFRPVFHQSRANFIAELSIYDRFGDPVYFYRGSSPSWDGTYRQGESAVEGVYFYLLYVVFPDGSKWSKTGDITLVR
jgi:gliding motility-associated-like protein